MSIFDLNNYLCRRKVLALTGKIHVYDEAGALVAFSKQKMLKLREDVRVFQDEGETNPLLTIKARQIIDLGATYDVATQEGAPLGALRRKGLKSILKDQWIILDPGGNETGSIDEDSTGKALARRFVPLMAFILAQSYTITNNGQVAGSFVRNHNPFVSKLQVSLSPESGGVFDRRLALAAAILLLIIEGKQQG